MIVVQRVCSLPAGLADVLRRAGYGAEALQQRLRAASPDDVGVLNYAAALERVAGDPSAAAVLIRLLFLEVEEPWRLVRQTLSPPACEQLVAAGLLRRRGASVRARVRIDPVGAHYVLADRRFHHADRRALRLPAGDAVYPPSSDSLLLRDAAVVAGAPQVLDLCTGSGIQALQVAHRAAGVVAVDINPRAVALAQLNAQLNGAGNVEVRVGDLYAPVRGERFDVVIANPPFVTSPYAAAPSYHSGGPTGDRVLRRIVAGLAAHLQPAGRFFAITHLGLHAGEDLQAVARRWFDGFPGRALVVVVESGTPVDLAAAQALFALDRGLRAYAAEVRRWVVYLRRHHIASIEVLLVAAERGARRGVEVVEAHARVLPIPLSRPPAERIAAWLG